MTKMELDLSSLSEHQVELDEEGKAYRPEDINAQNILTLMESMDQLNTLVTGFASKVNQSLSNLVERISFLESSLDRANSIITILSHRSDIMMAENPELHKKELEFWKKKTENEKQ